MFSDDDGQRFLVLTNGFVDRSSFPTLDEAVAEIEGRRNAADSFEIFDSLRRRFVWSRASARPDPGRPRPSAVQPRR